MYDRKEAIRILELNSGLTFGDFLLTTAMDLVSEAEIPDLLALYEAYLREPFPADPDPKHRRNATPNSHHHSRVPTYLNRDTLELGHGATKQVKHEGSK